MQATSAVTGDDAGAAGADVGRVRVTRLVVRDFRNVGSPGTELEFAL